MQNCKTIPYLFLLSITFSCGEIATQQSNASRPESDSSAVADNSRIPSITGTNPSRKHCKITGKVLEHNQFWAKEANALVCVVADKETRDAELGDSHRILEVYDTRTCELVERKVLPIDRSPDFPYYLAKISYNNSSKMVAIRGFDKIYCYDLEERHLSSPIIPAFLNERYAEDAQSGMIKRLEVWENYLIGYAQDMGVFVFDLDNRQQPQALMPIAEFEVLEGERYNSLFLLKSKNDTYQAILPSYDASKDEFDIHPLFEKPKKMFTQINKRYRNNHFLILKEIRSDGTKSPIAVDMKKIERVILPEEVASQKNTAIIEWLKRKQG